MLSVKNVTYNVGKKVLLDNVSIDFEAGKLHLIIGPNGAGKSTLIKVICNQISSESGSVTYGNKDIRSYTVAECARMRAVLSQNIEVAFPLSVSEIVMMGRYPHFKGKPSPKDEIACEAAMQLFDVLDMADRNYMTLSGGEKQRVHFARVLAQIWYPDENNCRYLILDEPLTFLDVRYQYDFMQKVVALLQDNHLVVVGVVHDLNLAAKFGDKIVLLHEGRIVAAGDKFTVLTKEHIESVYKIQPFIHSENGNLNIWF
jgi:iron complex transport system ATP-binding protein